MSIRPGHLECAQEIGALRAQLRRSEERHDELEWRIGVMQIEINRWRAACPDMPIQTTGASA